MRVCYVREADAVEGDTLHALPVGDAIGHEADESCVCGPAVDPVMKQDGTFWWIATHHPLLKEETWNR